MVNIVEYGMEFVIFIAGQYFGIEVFQQVQSVLVDFLQFFVGNGVRGGVEVRGVAHEVTDGVAELAVSFAHLF